MALIPTAVTAYLGLVGLLAGSFINLAADRLPRRESVVSPRSHCRACGRQLNVVDLLPVVGYVVRGGRCATCASPIGIESPLVEGVAGAAMLAPIVVIGVWPGAAVGLLAVACWGLLVTAISARRFATAREPNRA